MTTYTRRKFVRAFSVTGPGAGFALGAVLPGRALAQTAAAGVGTPCVLNVRDFGAKGDGVSKDTAAIQAAIDACTRAGGGLVYLSCSTAAAAPASAAAPSTPSTTASS